MPARTNEKTDVNKTITAVEGIFVGHSEDRDALTGCTVLLLEEGSILACDVRGGYPGTYDTHSLETTKTFIEKQAIFLVGGDVFGFDAAIGVRRYLLEKGLASRRGKLPFIVGANIYDLDFGDIEKASYQQLGYDACINLSAEVVKEGNVGAGIGATVGKLRGLKYAMKGGVGSCYTTVAEGIKVGALVVTNAVGNIYDIETGKTIAGTRREDGLGFVEMKELLREYVDAQVVAKKATTIGVVATNVSLNHEQMIKVAEVAHNGLAMSIRPVHTSMDGDTLFAVSTRKLEVSNLTASVYNMTDIIGYLAAEQVAKAVLNSVRSARTLNNVRGLATG